MGSYYSSTRDLAEAEARHLLDDFFDMAYKSGLNRIDIIEILEHEVEALRLREKLPEIKLAVHRRADRDRSPRVSVSRGVSILPLGSLMRQIWTCRAKHNSYDSLYGAGPLLLYGVDHEASRSIQATPNSPVVSSVKISVPSRYCRPGRSASR